MRFFTTTRLSLIGFIGLFLIANPVQSETDQTQIKPISLSSKVFPCTECHQHIKVNKTQNVAFPLKAPHQNMKFKHMDEVNQCFFCHDNQDRNALVLFSGKKIKFDESYMLCGQCHSDVKKDWQNNLHGKQVGKWNGIKHKLSCATCHEAHSPYFKNMKAEAAPPFPKFGIKKHD